MRPTRPDTGGGARAAGVRRSDARGLAAALVTAALLAGCTPEEPVPAVPTETTLRQIGIGFEDVVDDEQDWDAVEARLEAVRANAVSVSVGRVEWTGFRQEDHPDAAPALVRETERDFVAEALAVLRADAAGEPRRITLSIDALVPAMIADDERIAGRSNDGEASDAFASAAALEGEVGDRIAALAEEVALRYAPDEVNLTELMFDASTFGDADLDSYRAATGAEDWPREAGGAIDVDHESLGRWRSGVIASVVERVAERVRPLGVQVSIDVRIDRQRPELGRPESGHDYRALAGVADRLVLWNYFGMHDGGPGVSPLVTSSLPAAGVDPSRVLVQVGMWGADESTPIEPGQLEEGLRLTATNGVSMVGVTPMSMLDDADWAAIGRVWR